MGENKVESLPRGESVGRARQLKMNYCLIIWKKCVKISEIIGYPG